jgi:hypothetical protein
MTNTTNMSRRRLLASSMPALAAAAAMAPVAVSALCRLPAGGDDPVFAAIERHRKAFEAYKSTGEISTRLYSEWEKQQDPRGFYLGEYPEIKHEVTGEIHALQFHEVHTGCMVPRYATCPANIDNSVPADCADADAWKAQKRREFDEWSGCNDGSPKSIAYDAWDAAHRRLVVATAELNTRPSTLAGVAALLRYIAEFHDDDGVWADCLFEEDDEDSERPPIINNNGLFKKILETLAETAESIGA